MKNYLKNILTIISVISFSSCDILDNDGSSISPLDSKINFKVVESYDYYEVASTPIIFIELQTDKSYGCSNFGVITHHYIGNKSISIEIIGIDKPDACLAALGPAFGRIKLGPLSGAFEINITNTNYSDTYNLSISESLIILDGKETTDTKPLNNFLWRYPKNSFAYLCGTLLSDSSLCGNFIDTLKSVITLSEFNFSDFAKIPYPKSSQGHYYNADARFFYYESEEEFDKIEEVMRTFKHSYFPTDDRVGITIISWMNKKIRSSLL